MNDAHNLPDPVLEQNPQAKLKRWWLFGSPMFYPQGGMQDFVQSYDTAAEALEAAKTQEFADRYAHYPLYNRLEWFHIFDSETHVIVIVDGDHLGPPADVGPVISMMTKEAG